MDIVYIVQNEHGEYEDRDHNIVYAGTDKEAALKQATSKYPATKFGVHTVYFSIWKDGKEVSEISRDADSDNWEWQHGKSNEFDIFGITVR